MANWSAVISEFAHTYPGEPDPLEIGWIRFKALIGGLSPYGLLHQLAKAQRAEREHAAAVADVTRQMATPASDSMGDYRHWSDLLDKATGRERPGKGKGDADQGLVSLDAWMATGGHRAAEGRNPTLDEEQRLANVKAQQGGDVE